MSKNIENITTNNPNNGDILIYQSEDGMTHIDVRMEQETVWLTQQQMAELFNSTIPNISIHIRNIYKEGELDKEATVKDFLIVQNEGGRQVSRHVAYYNLDVIISVGYRVKSKRGVLFRQWATKVLREYLFRGYAFVKSIHDRFLIIDDKEIYLIGASLKDLGRKLFAFSKMETQQMDVLKNYLATI